MLEVFQRGAVRRIYAAHRCPLGALGAFSSFLFFSSSSFFFLGGVLAYSPKGLRPHLGEKVRQSGRKSASIYEKKCVKVGEKVRQDRGETLTRPPNTHKIQ